MFFCYLLVAVLHIFCKVSMDHCTYVLAHLKVLLSIKLVSSSNPRANSIISTLPSDIHHVLDILDLEPLFFFRIMILYRDRIYNMYRAL
jgi:hypothetical protein